MRWIKVKYLKENASQLGLKVIYRRRKNAMVSGKRANQQHVDLKQFRNSAFLQHIQLYKRS